MITYYSILNFVPAKGTPLSLGLVALSQPKIYFKILPQRLALVQKQQPELIPELDRALHRLKTIIPQFSIAHEPTLVFDNEQDIDFLYLVASFRTEVLQFSTLQLFQGSFDVGAFEMLLGKLEGF